MCSSVRKSPGCSKTSHIKVLSRGEHKCKNTKIKTDIPSRGADEFVNGLLERFRDMQECPNKTKMQRNEPPQGSEQRLVKVQKHENETDLPSPEVDEFENGLFERFRDVQ